MLLLALLLQAAPDSTAIADALRNRLVGDSTMTAAYAANGWRPFWFADDAPRAAVAGLGTALREADRRGLDPADFPGGQLDQGALRLAAATAEGLAAVDDQLSREAVRLATALMRGRIMPAAVDSAIRIPRRPPVDVTPLLARLAGAPDPAAVFDTLEPRDPAYRRLEAALPGLRRLAERGIAFDTAVLPPVVRPDDAGAAMPALARFLTALGDLPPPGVGDDSLAYGPDLVAAVRRFQARHGLAADGVIGPATRAALGVPLAWRVRQAELALERWRWFADPAATPVLDVDVAGARLAFRDSVAAAPRFEAAVIVGRPDWATPILEAPIARIVIHPEWVVPTSIARGELLGEFAADTTLFARAGYELRRGEAVIPPTAENLAAIGRGVVLRQRPGPANALGAIKLEVEGTTAIHLHDTPDRRRFAAQDRFLSHGCIRVQRVGDLARLLLAGDPDWPAARIDSVLADSATVIIPLRRSVRLRLAYATAAVTADGHWWFRPDRYRRDPRLDAALRSREPE